MPLVRMAARTAVVAGTATAVSNRVSRRQYNRWSDQEAEQRPLLRRDLHERLPDVLFQGRRGGRLVNNNIEARHVGTHERSGVGLPS